MDGVDRLKILKDAGFYQTINGFEKTDWIEEERRLYFTTTVTRSVFTEGILNVVVYFGDESQYDHMILLEREATLDNLLMTINECFETMKQLSEKMLITAGMLKLMK